MSYRVQSDHRMCI